MHDIVLQAEYEPLDDGLEHILEQTTGAFTSILNELLALVERDNVESHRVNLLRWAIMYAVVLRDLSRSATLLLRDGSHTRAALMLRRVAFEYFTRFRFFQMYPENATTAMGEFETQSARFASRVPGQVTFIQDPKFDYEHFEDAPKPYQNFKAICDAVHGEHAPECYAHFYSYPSFLLHGGVMLSMDVLKFDGDQQGIHLDSPRPFTNQIVGNLIVFLLEFAGDVVGTFDMATQSVREELAVRFNERRRTLHLLETQP